MNFLKDKTYFYCFFGSLLTLIFLYYLWRVRFQFDPSPLYTTGIIFLINSILGALVFNRTRLASYFLMGSIVFLILLDLILVRKLILLS